MIQSWDLFDTLIIRRCIEPSAIFDIVSAKTDNLEFKKYRETASKKSDGTWENIYDQYQKLSNCSKEERQHLQKTEIETEKEQLVLNIELYNQVQDGDIIVSDMYFPELILREFLLHLNFQKQVSIFVSSNGKATGRIWSNGIIPINIVKNIKFHTGDNLWSDITAARLKGISAQHYTNTSLTKSEKTMRTSGFETICQCMRVTRLSNPYPQRTQNHTLWNQQISLNIPLVCLASIELYKYAKERNINTFLFASRDCAIWNIVFSAMYPTCEVHYIAASRKIMLKPTTAYISYMKSLVSEKQFIFVDLQASGTSTRSFFKNHMGMETITIFIMLLQKWLSKALMGKTTNTGFNASGINDKKCGDKVEKLNYDLVGTLIDFTEKGPIRADPEYDISLIKPYHAAATKFIEQLKLSSVDHGQYKNPTNELIHKYLAEIEYTDVLDDVKHVHIHDSSLILPYITTSPWAKYIIGTIVVIVVAFCIFLLIRIFKQKNDKC